MKWVVVASLICCGGLLILTLLGANAALILGLVLNNWPVFLLGFAVIVGAVYYAWRYGYLKRRSQSEVSASQIEDDKGRNDWEA